MISYIQALNKIFEYLPKLNVETKTIECAHSFFLAENILSETDLPPFTNSAMDGYAVRWKDLQALNNTKSLLLKVVGRSLAGESYHASLGKGTTVYITTGARIPDGADTVIPVENIQKVSGNRIEILKTGRLYDHFRFAGDDIKQGELLLPSHSLLGDAQLALLASIGKTKFKVFKKPVIGFLATGDELVNPSQQPKPDQIRDSNTTSIRVLVADCNCKFLTFGISGDQENAILKKFQNKTLPDILITSAGVSVGETDIVRKTLEKIGLEVIFWKVAIKPGKPLLFGKINNTLFFGLPGNPVSGSVVFRQFIQPVILTLAGSKKQFTCIFDALLEDTIDKSDGRLHFVRGFCYYDGKWKVRSAGKQNSNNVSALADANCFILQPPDQVLKKNKSVKIQLLEGPRVDLESVKQSFAQFFA